MSNFHVGQKVVWIGPVDVEGYSDYDDNELDDLEEGVVYEISGFVPTHDDDMLILLKGMRNGRDTDYHYQGYSPFEFRPVEERKTDISIFKAMLTPSKQPVTA